MEAAVSTMTFVNLPVKDLARSKEFFTSLGFGFNEQFGDDNTACLVISDLAFVMLHVEPTFAQFTRQEIVDTSQSREVLVGLSAQSRGEVDALVDKAVASGGEMLGDAQDQGFMYMRAFLDADGHQWSSIHMDLSATPQE
jgi:predicted lactoylglutathione lyase